jgi:hypothetical protein
MYLEPQTTVRKFLVLNRANDEKRRNGFRLTYFLQQHKLAPLVYYTLHQRLWTTAASFF